MLDVVWECWIWSCPCWIGVQNKQCHLKSDWGPAFIIRRRTVRSLPLTKATLKYGPLKTSCSHFDPSQVWCEHNWRSMWVCRNSGKLHTKVEKSRNENKKFPEAHTFRLLRTHPMNEPYVVVQWMRDLKRVLSAIVCFGTPIQHGQTLSSMDKILSSIPKPYPAWTRSIQHGQGWCSMRIISSNPKGDGRSGWCSMCM